LEETNSLKYIAVILLFLFYGLLHYQEEKKDSLSSLPVTSGSEALRNLNDSDFIPAKAKLTEYQISASLDVNKKILHGAETIWWRNNSSYPTSELYFHLYPNAFSNSKTEFLKGRGLPQKSYAHVILNEVNVNKTRANLSYVLPRNGNRFDSTVVKITLNTSLAKGDSIQIDFLFDVVIPKAVSRFGYDANERFFFFAQWFPKLGVYENGKWICEPYYSFTEFYSDFAHYKLDINIPKEFTFLSSGDVVRKSLDRTNATYTVMRKNIHDFAWVAAKEVTTFTDTLTTAQKKKVAVHYMLQPTNEDSKERIFTAVKNAFIYCDRNIGSFPYSSFAVVDAPVKAGTIGAMEYPALFTFSKEYFSPEFTKDVEELLIHEFAHQYFYSLLANNETAEAWLDEGFATYLSQKILIKKYEQRFASFKLFGYLPVTGMEFLSIERIPIIYTLTQIPKPFESDLLAEYYPYAAMGSLSDTSYQLLNRKVYQSVSYAKGALFLLTLENFLGEKKLLFILRQYVEQYRYKHPTAEDFFSVVRKYGRKNIDWLIEGFYKNSYVCDYKLLSLSALPDQHSVEVVVVRDGEAVVPTEVALYTEKDTLRINWSGKEKIKKFIFETNNIPIAAEVDPLRNNLFDLNFANNSYVLATQYSGATYLSVRWFFWIQNLLMIFGGLA